MKSRSWAGISRLGGVGDNLIAASVFRPLKKLGYNVDVITAEKNHEVFHHNPYIDKLSIKYEGDLPSDGLEWQQWFKKRSREYELFVNLSQSCECLHAVIPAMAEFYWPEAFRRKRCAGSYLETIHDIVGVPHEFGPLFFASGDEKLRAIETKQKIVGDGGLIGWCLSGTRVDKVHPHSPMIIARIIRETGLGVMLFGAGPDQFDMAKTIMEHVELQNGSCDGLFAAITPDEIDPGDKYDWPLRRALSQVLACDLVIGPDTGLMWAAAFEQMPKVMLLSHASAENITKHWINTTTLHADSNRVPCWPCHQLHNSMETCTYNKDKSGAACISDISAETIMQAIMDGLSAGAASEAFKNAAE